jgi:hypothetical protein
MAIKTQMWRIGLSLGLVAGMWTLDVARADNVVVQVVALDECDPTPEPPSVNAAFGAGTCVNVGGTVTLPDFLAALPTGHAQWLFQPLTTTIGKHDTIRATNQGGEIHTFTEVAAFGGGFIPSLNNPVNSPTIPECEGGYANAGVASTRIIQGSSLVISGLKKGVHHFECCIHPWMRMDVEVK